MQFACDADGYRLLGAVEDVGPGVGDGPADADVSLAALPCEAGGRVGGVFAGAVEVVDALGAAAGIQGLHEAIRQGFSGQVDDAHGAGDGAAALQFGYRGRDGVDEGDGVAVCCSCGLLRCRQVEDVVDDPDAAAAAQGDVEFEDREVEADRGRGQYAFQAFPVEVVQRPGEEGAGVAVCDADAFGFAGRARGVDDVGEVAGGGGVDGVAVGLGQFAPLAVEAEGGAVVPRQGGQEPFLGQEDGGIGVVEHGSHALGRVGRVERHIGAAGFEDAQQADEHVKRAFDADAYQDVGADAPASQVVRQPVGSGVEFGVGELLSFAHDGDGLGSPGDLCFDQLVDGARAGVFLPGVVPVFQQLLPFAVLQHGQVGNAGFRLGDDGVEQGAEVPGQAFDGAAVEEVGAVFDFALECAAGFGNGECEVVFGAAGAAADRLQLQLRQVEIAFGGVLQQEHDLEQGGVAGVPFRFEDVDQLFERDVLVGVGFEGGAADALQQAAYAFLPVHPGAQDEGVDEEADQAFDFATVPVGDGGADADVLLPGVPAKQDVVGRRQAHEEGALGLPVQGMQPGGGGRADAEAVAGAAVALDGRPHPVGREGQQCRSALQLLLPVGQLFVQYGAAKPLPLPLGVVGVLDGQGRQDRAQVLSRMPHAGGIEGGEFVEEDAHRPAVRGDVVGGEEEDVVVFGQFEQPGAQQRALFEVERAEGFVLHGPFGFGFPLRRQEAA